MAAPACPGAASALKKAAQACFDAASALKMAILACSGATSALKKPARARFSATECAQRGCSSLLFEITIQKCWSRLYSDLSHCTLLHFATCMDMMRSQLNRFVATHNLCKFNSPSECGIPGDAVTGMLSKLSAQSMCASVQ